MALLKCKMCGGDLDIVEGSTVCVCEYCGTKQTVPSFDSEKKITQPLICQKAKQWGVQFISIEATKTTSSYVEGISERLKEDGYSCSVTSNTKTFTGEGKAQRIFNHAPDIREYMLFLDGERSKEYDQFMANVYSFKLVGKNKHDDAPDSLAMAVEYALNRQQRNVVRVARRVF